MVLTNSMSNNDAADWLGQLVLEAILDTPDRNDYIALARSSVEASNNLWPQDLERGRIPDTPLPGYYGFFGSYYWHMEGWVEEIHCTCVIKWPEGFLPTHLFMAAHPR